MQEDVNNTRNCDLNHMTLVKAKPMIARAAARNFKRKVDKMEEYQHLLVDTENELENLIEEYLSN